MAEDVIYDDLASGLVHRGRDAVQAYVEQTHDSRATTGSSR